MYRMEMKTLINHNYEKKCTLNNCHHNTGKAIIIEVKENKSNL